MTFELKTGIDEEEKEYEIIEESTTAVNTTVKMWTSSQLEAAIAEIEIEIITLQERKALLQEQLPKFTAVKETIK